MNPRAKFRANICNSKQVMGDNEIQNGGRRHLEFITIANFGYIAHFL